MSAPVVSIVTTFLDTPAAFLEEAVASVEAQSFRDWELILVNDGASLELARLANDIAARSHGRIVSISHPDRINHGIPASRNLGARIARGEYLAFLDADDVWLPHKLDEQLAALKRHPTAWMVFGRSVYWSTWDTRPARRQEDETPELGVRDETLFRAPAFLHSLFRRRVLVPCPSCIMVRASAFHAIGGFEESQPNTFEDQGFYTKIGLHGTALARNRVWARYRIHAGSVMQRASRKQHLADRRQFLDWVLRYTDEHGHHDRGFRRTLRLELAAAGIPGAPRVLRSLRRLAALGARIRLAWTPQEKR